MQLWAELKRRNVIRVAGLYLVGSWMIVQVAETLFPAFDVPNWALRAMVIVLALGFIPALIFSWVFEMTPEGLKREDQMDRSRGGDNPARKLDIAVIALLLLIGGFQLWAYFHTAEPRKAEVVTADAPAVDAVAGAKANITISDKSVPDQKSIAVLAFADMSPQKDQEYFADGIAEEILNALAKVDGLKVAGRTSAFHFKGRNESLSQIGAALGVANVLEGSVRKQGDKVRITAQLIQASDGFHLWSETYDGELSDVFELQERIARSITDELRIVLKGGQADRLVHAGTTNTEAYALYLEATAIFNQRDGRRFDEALKMLDRALELDPGYARAWSRKATLLSVNADYRSSSSMARVNEVGKAAHRASELDPGLAEPHAAMALSLLSERRYREYRREMERALELDPNDVTANFWHGAALVNSGYREQAKTVLDRTLEIDPYLPNALLWRARIHIADGEYDIATEQLQRAAKGGHAFVGIGNSWLSLHAGDRATAARQLTEGLQAYFSQGFPPDASVAFARASVGYADAKSEALGYIDAYLAEKPSVMAGVVPYVLFRMGEVQRGFDAVREKPTSNDSMAVSELFSGLVPEVMHAPGFPEFIRKMGLADYWDEFGPPENCSKSSNGDYTCE